jgi:hypothetical protein
MIAWLEEFRKALAKALDALYPCGYCNGLGGYLREGILVRCTYCEGSGTLREKEEEK